MTIAQLATSPEATALYALIVAGLEKKFQFIKPVVAWAENHKGIVTATEQAVGEIVHSPKLAEVELKLNHALQQVEQSQVFKAATAVLHNLTTRVENMTADEKNAVGLSIATEVHNLFGATVSVHQAVGVLDEFQKLAESLAGRPSVQGAEQITAATVPAVDATATA